MTEPLRTVGHFTIGADHPSLPGHFPGRPVVPGVVLLDEVLACLAARTVLTAKFTRPVGPGTEVEVQARTEPSGRTVFACFAAGQPVLNGSAAP